MLPAAARCFVARVACALGVFCALSPAVRARAGDETTAAKPRLTRLVELFADRDPVHAQSLDFWPSHRAVLDLARDVRALRASEADLRSVLAARTWFDTRRGNIVLAHAWTTDRTPEVDGWLATEAQTALARRYRFGRSQYEVELYAVYALALRGAESALSTLLLAALDECARTSDRNDPTSMGYDCAVACLTGMRSLGDARVRAAVDRIRNGSGELDELAFAAWVLFARAGSPDEVHAAREEFRRAAAPDPRWIVLEGVWNRWFNVQMTANARAGAIPERVWREQLALGRLLELGTPASCVEFVQRVAAADARKTLLPNAVRSVDDVRCIGVLCSLESEFRGDETARGELARAVERLASVMRTLHADHPDARAACDGIERALLAAGRDGSTVERSLAVWLQVASPGDAARIRAALGDRPVSAELARAVDQLR